jgi:RecG-like helicase
MTGGLASAPVNGQRRGAVTPIGDVRWRQHARIRGRIRSMRVQPWANVASLECVVVDDTGGLVIVFLGRRQVAGLELGRWLYADGVVGNHRGYLAILNPEIDLIVEDHEAAPSRTPGERKRRWWRKG